MEHQLQHMYQAWQQDNEHYKRDWSYFVEFASQKTGLSGDKIMQILQKCNWFYYTGE